LSSRPERSEVEGPAVLPTNHWMRVEPPPTLIFATWWMDPRLPFSLTQRVIAAQIETQGRH
jgi:hypothetical protein